MYELSPLARHLADADIVLAAGALVPPSWTALRDRHAQPLDGSMSRRYVEATITGQGDLLALRTAAIAEVVAMNNMPAQAAIANVLDSAVAAELQAIYAPTGPGVFDYCADRFAATAGRFHKACSVVDVECDPATLITSSQAQRTQWSDGGVLAHELDLGLSALAAAARLAGVETCFISTNPLYSYLSSSLVKEVATHGGDVTGLVPESVLKRLKSKISSTM